MKHGSTPYLEKKENDSAEGGVSLYFSSPLPLAINKEIGK